MSNTSNKFYGIVGYITTEESKTGVAVPVATEKQYYGDVITLSSRWQTNENVNDDITVSHRISIIADPYAFKNFSYIRYVEWMGTRWEVKSVEVKFPRLVLALGGVYNG